MPPAHFLTYPVLHAVTPRLFRSFQDAVNAKKSNKNSPRDYNSRGFLRKEKFRIWWPFSD